ncbi:putative nuclease HARBI1 [Odontomachus brunneus]|uniref:putative nuclease HARBI1 n=1 Tax=Odontomachus brunneus TaxID=486640 RepID=UPI0013F185F0|nr:putative nuclease HARBI1 [Odontomachus brunneus]
MAEIIVASTVQILQDSSNESSSSSEEEILQSTTFEYILSIISNDLVRKIKRCSTIPPDQQLMIALWKMATMDSYRIAQQYICWPSDDRAQIIMHNFERASGFPKIIGAIDGTHIKIEAPKQNPTDYINRKGYHSIQLQSFSGRCSICITRTSLSAV